MSAKWLAFKPGVRLNRCTPHTMEVLNMLLETAPDLYADTVVITSVNDGRHASASAHYSNDAWDVRTHPAGNKPRNGNILASNIDETAKYWVRALRRKLRLEYFVQYEQAKQHIHIQRAQLRS